MDTDLEKEQKELQTKQATAQIRPPPSQDNFLHHDRGSDHKQPSQDIEDLEQQILNMEYDPTGADDSRRHRIADIAADFEESQETAANR